MRAAQVCPVGWAVPGQSCSGSLLCGTWKSWRCSPGKGAGLWKEEKDPSSWCVLSPGHSPEPGPAWAWLSCCPAFPCCSCLTPGLSPPPLCAFLAGSVWLLSCLSGDQGVKSCSAASSRAGKILASSSAPICRTHICVWPVSLSRDSAEGKSCEFFIGACSRGWAQQKGCRGLDTLHFMGQEHTDWPGPHRKGEFGSCSPCHGAGIYVNEINKSGTTSSAGCSCTQIPAGGFGAGFPIPVEISLVWGGEGYFCLFMALAGLCAADTSPDHADPVLQVPHHEQSRGWKQSP